MVPSRQLSQLSILVIAAGAWVSLPLAGLFAGDGSRLQPVPESQSVPNAPHCPHCQHGQGHAHPQSVQGAPVGHYHGGVQGYCPSCQQNNRVWGHGQRRLSPGTGWCAPGKIPVVRERVQYQQYYPHYWSGNGPGPAVPHRPMVYTPTDTTQLGFYYQHAPSWTSQPWRVPGPPHPAYWHNRACGSNCRQPGHHHAYQGSYYQQISSGAVISSPTLAQESQVAPQPHEIQAPQTILIPPTPEFRSKTPIMSALPDAPPEV